MENHSTELKQEHREQLVTEWHDRWHDLVLQILARRLPAQADVQDLAQEVFLRLLRVNQLDLVENPRAYLYRVAVNIASEWRLKDARMPTTSTDYIPEEVTTAPGSLEGWLEQRQNRDVIRAALMELPVAYRTALLMHVREDLTYAEIAEHMGRGVTKLMVKRYLAKAYSKLRRHMLGAGIGSRL